MNRMTNQTKILLAVFALLLLLAAVLVTVHRITREKVPENSLAIHIGEKTVIVEIAKLPLTQIRGNLINGKGEAIPVDAKGLELADVLREVGLELKTVRAVTVKATDEFTAEVSGEECSESGKVCLISAEEGLQLVVFGDKNMKRSVRNVIAVYVES